MSEFTDPSPNASGAEPHPRRKAEQRPRAKAVEAMRGRVKAHDPFELIRWLAFSQTDPRKALAELVQNSLDAGATKVRITRVREKGTVCLRIVDNGAGPIPELDRPEALRFIATNIGHSRKRSLSPQERLELMTQGQYGIGLLGFWAIGETLEMRTAIPGQRSHRLVLRRDSPDFVIEPLRGRLDLAERWTEVVVVGVHREVQSALGGRRIADYLGAELRGQLLSREVHLLVEDRISRGRSQKLLEVRPPRFLGQPIEGLGPVTVPGGFAPIRLELYLVGDGGTGAPPAPIAVYAAGTLAAESFHELASLGLDRAPWNDPRLTGFVDYASFTIAPGSRRGILIDSAADAFATAIAAVEPTLLAFVEAAEKSRAAEQDRGLIKSLQRAFRDFYKHQPRYEMLPVKDTSATAAGAEPGEVKGAAVNGSGPGATETASGEATGEDGESPPAVTHDEEETDLLSGMFLLPPGPLAAIRLIPQKVRVPCGSERKLRAEGVDADGRVVPDPLEFTWRIEGDPGVFLPDRVTRVFHRTGNGIDSIVFEADQRPRRGRLTIEARAGNYEALLQLPIHVIDDFASRGGEGIPEPEFVHYSGTPWRSRMFEGRWQVNSGHPDFRRIEERPGLKLRYLAMLFSKEIVLRSHRDPRLEAILEQLVEVAAYADRNLAGRRGEA